MPEAASNPRGRFGHAYTSEKNDVFHIEQGGRTEGGGKPINACSERLIGLAGTPTSYVSSEGLWLSWGRISQVSTWNNPCY